MSLVIVLTLYCVLVGSLPNVRYETPAESCCVKTVFNPVTVAEPFVTVDLTVEDHAGRSRHLLIPDRLEVEGVRQVGGLASLAGDRRGNQALLDPRRVAEHLLVHVVVHHQTQLSGVFQRNLLVSQDVPRVELVGNLDLALGRPDDRGVGVEVGRGDQRRDLAVEVFLGPLVERVEELLRQVNRGLPLLEVLELKGGTGPGLEDQGDVVRADRGRGQLAIVDRRQRADVGEVDVDRLADAGRLGLDVLVDGIQQRGAADLGLGCTRRRRRRASRRMLRNCSPSEVTFHESPWPGPSHVARELDNEQTICLI